MERLHCATRDELDQVLRRAGPDSLFRGQIEHHIRPDGAASLRTSFSRQGCTPPLMIKWNHYARKALSKYVRGWKPTSDTATDQAILQHYGWMSFFLDMTGDPSVAAWFASHRYSETQGMELVEDCFEDPVFAITRNAKFQAVTEGNGHLYVISRRMVRTHAMEAVQLSEIATHEGSPRYLRQDAYMLGPVPLVGLPEACIVAHISAPMSILQDVATGHTTASLFPEPEDDPIFGELLSLPWAKVPVAKRYTTLREAEQFLLPLLEIVMLCADVATSVISVNRKAGHAAGLPFPGINVGSSSLLVQPGQRDIAISHIQQWLRTHCGDWLIYCDPYFTHADLAFLRLVLAENPATRVTILTSKLAFDKKRLEFSSASFYAEWAGMVDQDPPHTNIIALSGTPGSSPIHDRWIISATAGLRIGTSFGSLGEGKLSEISSLEDSEAERVAAELKRFCNGERVIAGVRIEYLTASL